MATSLSFLIIRNSMTINIPAGAEEIINIINKAGHEAYVVGGCVRDSLLGREPNDWDITTSANPYEVKALFRRTIDTGLKHGTVTILMGDEQYEVTTYRIDGDYSDGRHPDSVTYTSLLSDDLKRRDFTINAMAYHPEKGLVDLFGGEIDLKKGIVRAVGCAEDRFSEDALRMMRAIRFAAQLGYDIEKSTYAAITKLKDNLAKISAERIRVEMEKLLVSDNPYMFKLFYDTKLTSVFMPEFDVAMGTKQQHTHHMYDVGEHILQSLKYTPNNKVIRLAMLFHDMAKPQAMQIDEQGVTHFWGHPAMSAAMAKDIMRRLKYDNATIDAVAELAANHDRHIEENTRSVRRTLSKLSDNAFPLLLKVKYADVMAQSDYMRSEKLATINRLEELYNEIIRDNNCFKLKDLSVGGSDLIEQGERPGPNLGKILNAMLQDVIEQPEHNTKEYLLSHLEEYKNQEKETNE